MSKEAKTSNFVKNRSEIIFIYDVRDCNPNGDPLADNRPRIDEETGLCYVTDVRLKRTIRDYLRDFEKQTIFIDEFDKDDGTIKMAQERALDFSDKDDSTRDVELKILSQCIDTRLFGCAIPLGEKKKSVQITGPVQFNYASSVHQVEPIFMQGTAAFASKKKALQRSFREDYIIHYGLFKFYGIINEKLGEISQLTKADVDLLMNGLWIGTNRLQSRSKIGHLSRLLIKIEYSDPLFFIGQVDKLVKITKKDANQEDVALRDISELKVDLSALNDAFINNKDKIEKIHIKVHPEFLKSAGYTSIAELIKSWQDDKLPVSEFSFI